MSLYYFIDVSKSQECHNMMILLDIYAVVHVKARILAIGIACHDMSYAFHATPHQYLQ